MERRPLTEIGVSALVALICAVFFVQATKLPPGSFEPLGSGPVPQVTSGIVFLCCIVVIIRASIALRDGPGLIATLRREFSGPATGGFLMLGMSALYVALLQWRIAPFGLVTFGFLTLLILALEGFRPRAIIPALITAAVAAFGAEYLFTNVFVVDLPT